MVLKSFWILPGVLFGPSIQLQDKLLSVGCQELYRGVPKLLEVKEDLEIPGFFHGIAAGRNKVQIIWREAHGSHARCAIELCAVFLLAPSAPWPCIPCIVSGERGAGEQLLLSPWKSSWICCCTWKGQRDTSEQKDNTWTAGCGLPSCSRAVCWLSHSPDCWKLQVEGSTACIAGMAARGVRNPIASVCWSFLFTPVGLTSFRG